MHKLLLIAIALFSILYAEASTAIIQDIDGYCNVRREPNIQAEILDTLVNGRIVFVFEAVEGNWLPIDYKKGTENHSGYIHRSRIVFIADLTSFKRTSINDTTIRLHFDSLQIVISRKKFNSTGRKLQYASVEDGKFLHKIDGKEFWGSDGNIPVNEYKNIQFKFANETVSTARSHFQNLFEPNLDYTSAYIDKRTKRIYLEAYNSDGAGAYVVIWTIKDKRIISRDIFIPF